MKKAVIPGFDVKYLSVRGDGNFLYRRRFPSKYKILVNGQLEFKASLNTKNANQAIEKYGQIHAHFENLMNRLKAGKSLSSTEIEPINVLKAKASDLGVPYKSAQDLIKDDDISQFLERLKLADNLPPSDEIGLQALFGAAPDEPTLNDVLDFYEEHNRDKLIKLSDREKAKKITPIQLAVARVNDFLGASKPLAEITRQDALSYKSYWVDIVEDGEKSAATANKQIMHIRKIITFYLEQNALTQSNPFSKIHLEEEKGSRPAYTIQFLKDKWLTGSPFESLSQEALHILYVIMDTGAGPKEICGLAPEDIHLDQAIPYLEIKPNIFRKLKTGHRDRKIPLVGMSLKALKQYPTGFSSYRTPNGPDNFSANVNKYLKAHNLIETDQHGIYSLRHTFKNRMREHSFPAELQNYLMGHKDGSMGAKYGDVYNPNQALSFMRKLEQDLII